MGDWGETLMARCSFRESMRRSEYEVGVEECGCPLDRVPCAAAVAGNLADLIMGICSD